MLPVQASVLLNHQQGLATRQQLLQAGATGAALTRAVRDGTLSRVGRGLYRDRAAPARGQYLLSGGLPDPGYVADVRRAMLRLGSGARAARRTAAVVWGLDMQVEPTGVDLDVPHGRRAPALDGVSTRESRCDRSLLWVPIAGVAPLPVTPPVDTVLECARVLPLTQAVVIVDSALRAGRTTAQALREGARELRGVGDLAHVRQVLRWCDARSGSVLESILRVLLCVNGLAPPAAQMVLTDPVSGRTSRVDFAWPHSRLVVECDGRRWHDPQDRRDADRRRDNLCARLGWRVLRFTWAEIVHQPERVVAEVRAALAA